MQLLQYRVTEAVEETLPHDAPRAAAELVIGPAPAEQVLDDRLYEHEARSNVVLDDHFQHAGGLGDLARHELRVPGGPAFAEEAADHGVDEAAQPLLRRGVDQRTGRDVLHGT